jgi:hypothetical protein
MDELMQEIGPRPPLVATQAKPEELSSQSTTLREHYRKKRAHYGVDHPNFYDRDLRRLFSDDPAHADKKPAAQFVSRIRREVRQRVSRWTGAYQYTIDQVIKDIIARCRELDLRVARPEEETRMEFTTLLTVQTMNYLHSGRHRVAL